MEQKFLTGNDGMTIDCSLSGYAEAFQQELQKCIREQPPIVAHDGPEVYWVGMAAANAFKKMSANCRARAGSANCTPKGYALAVVEKLDPEKKIVKIAVSKVSKNAAKNLGITPAAVGCAAGALVGGAIGALVTLPEGVPYVGAAVGGVYGCTVGTKIGPVVYNGYKIITKINKYYNTAVEVKNALKDHSNVCRAHPLLSPNPPPSMTPSPSLHRDQCQTGLAKERLRDRSLNSFFPKPPYTPFIQPGLSSFQQRGSFHGFHYPYLNPYFNPPLSSGFSNSTKDYWVVRDAVQQAIRSEVHSPAPNLFSAYLKASLSLGFGYSLSLTEFRSVAASTSLISSYNSFNPTAKLRDVMNFCRDIGGIGNDVSVITDMIDSAAHAEAQEYFLCFPADHFPFSPALLKQLTRELAEGYFNHKTVPFFSLHFNENGFLYPVIHPAYKNTLVGEIIALLDYWMKGFLNGGVFDEEFLKMWHETANCDEAYLRSKLIDLKKYCKESCKDVPYVSLRELMSRYGLNDTNMQCEYRQPFMTSFRIISSQEKIERHHNVLIPYPTFRVEYSIDLMPDYKNYLESYCKEHGHYPKEYQNTRLCYELFAEEIKAKLPKMPFCRDFFRLLGVMNLFCYFYATLNQMGKRPVLEPLPPVHNYPSPKAYPPIPVRYFRRYSLIVTFGAVIRQMHTLSNSLTIDGMLANTFANKHIRQLPEPALNKVHQGVTEIINTEMRTQIPPNEPLNLNEEEVERITRIAQAHLRQHVHQAQAAYHRLLNRLMVHLKESERQPLLSLTLIDKINQTKEALKQHLEGLKARWTAEPSLAKEEVFNEIPQILHQSIRDNFKKIEEDTQKELQELIEKVKSDAEKNIQERIAEWRKQDAAADEKFLADFRKQEKEVTDKAIADNESTIRKVNATELQQAKAELGKITPLKTAQEGQIAQAEQAIQQLEKNRVKQIASVPANARNHASIHSFTNSVNKKKAEIQKEIGEMRKHLQQINNAIAATNKGIADMPSKVNALIASERTRITNKIHANVEQQIAEIKASASHKLSKKIDDYTSSERKLLEEYIANVKANAPKAVQEACKNEALQILDLLYEQNIERIKTVEERTRHFTQTLLTIPQIVDHKLSEHYTHALMGFTGQDLAKQTGDRFQIIGGCGMSLPNLTSQPIADGEAFYNIATKACPIKAEETQTFEFHNISYTVFKLQVAESREVVVEDPSVEKPLTVLEELCESEEPLPSIPPEISSIAIDKSGAKLIHYGAALLEKTRFKQLLTTTAQISTADQFGNLPIHAAAYTGNVDAVEVLIAHDPSQMEAKNRSDATALMLAVQYGKMGVVEKLLSLGAQVNQRLPNGLFPLYLAVQNNYPEIALLLLERGPNIAICEKLDSGMTALHLAIDNGLPEVALRLIAKGADLEIKRKADGFTPWHCAAEQGRLSLPILKAMAARGVSLHQALESEKTALHLAAEAGHLETVQYLLASGLNVNAKTRDGDTPLMLAIKMGHTSVAEALAQVSAINTVNAQDQTASVVALQYGMPTIGDNLLKRGENPELCDRQGYNYVYYLVRNDEYNRFMLLAEKQTLQLQQQFNGESLSAIAARYGHFLLTYALLDLNVNIKSSHNAWELIHYAMMTDEVDLLREWLMEHKISDGDAAGKGTQDKAISLAYLAARHGSRNCLDLLLGKLTVEEMEGQGLLSAALDSGDTETVKKVLRRWKDINQPLDDKGNTALHYAVNIGSRLMMELLLKCGSRPQVRNHAGQTPFHIALQQNDAYLLKRLFKLTPSEEWPKDLIQTKTTDESSKIAEVLKKYGKRLSIEDEKAAASTPENTLSSDSKALQEDLNELKAFFEVEAFEEAVEFLEQKPSLLAEFKSSHGGKLLQAIFKNVYDYSFLKAALIKEGGDDINELSDFTSPDRLLALLKKQGIDPAVFSGKYNPLLGMIGAKTDEEACYRLDLFLRYFASSMTALANDPLMPIADLALKKNYRHFFMKLDELCRQHASGKDTLSCSLHHVVCDENYELTETLLKHYPADSLNHKKQTPLMLAASKNNTRLMALLLSHGAVPDRVDLDGRNALHYAVQAKSESAALFILPLLRHHNLPDRRGVTPLLLAAMKGLLPIVRCLCSEANYTQIVDDRGHNALHKAAIAGHKEVIKYLVQQGFAIDQAEAPCAPARYIDVVSEPRCILPR